MNEVGVMFSSDPFSSTGDYQSKREKKNEDRWEESSEIFHKKTFWGVSSAFGAVVHSETRIESRHMPSFPNSCSHDDRFNPVTQQCCTFCTKILTVNVTNLSTCTPVVLKSNGVKLPIEQIRVLFQLRCGSAGQRIILHSSVLLFAKEMRVDWRLFIGQPRIEGGRAEHNFLTWFCHQTNSNDVLEQT